MKRRNGLRGSVIYTANSAGSFQAINSYDEYGIPGSTNAGRFQYTGQAWYAELGMYYYKARIYSPTLGRFLQTDPIGYEDQVNLYAYVGNDPINGTDPTGLSDVNLFDDDDVWHEFAEEFDEGGSHPIFTVMGHGFEDGTILDDRDGSGERINAEQLLGIMRENGFEDGQTVLITTCNCGNGPIPQQIADLTGSNVIAADGFASFNVPEFESGELVLRSFPIRGDYSRENQGGWWTFRDGGRAPIRSGDAAVDNGLAVGIRRISPHPRPTVDGVRVKK